MLTENIFAISKVGKASWTKPVRVRAPYVV